MRLTVLVPALLLAASPACAGELFVGLHKHAVDTPLSLGGGEERGADFSLGYRLDGVAGTGLQPYVFGALNSAGDTSYAAAGLSYRLGGKLYVRPGVGLAIHNGSTSKFEITNNGQIDFGSRVLFEPELAAGIQATPRLGVEASWVHMSHAQLFGKQNPGIDNIGVRLNWKL